MLTTLLSPDSGTVHIAGVDLSTSPEEVRRLDLHPTPGCSNERVRIFLARELTPTGHPHPRRHKEATLQVARFPLDKALHMALTGEITNAAAVVGLLATAHAREQAWATLRPADAPWPSPVPGSL
jgi:8-oxo-dGDP phosphatase